MMKCPKCGKKMKYKENEYAPDTFDCECGEWIEVSIGFNEMKAQKEKAEEELKAIKNHFNKINYFIQKNSEYRWTDIFQDDIEVIENILKQIGGE